MRHTYIASFMFCALLTSCAPGRFDPGEPGDDPDGGGMPPPGPTRCDAMTPCPGGRLCVDNVCIPDNGTCTEEGKNDSCSNDTYCACPPNVKAPGCVCIHWGMKPKGDSDPMCQGEAFAPGDFKAPVLKCQWPAPGMSPPYANVISTPIVIDLDKDGQPEIVFAAGYPGQVHLVAMSGKDCSVKFDKGTSINGCTQIA